MPVQQTVREQLQSQLARLLTRADKIGADLRQSHDRDSTEQATERENDEVLSGLDEITVDEIGRIRTALARIDDGTYGTCTRCGHAISEERLAALPAALVCLACSSEAARDLADPGLP